MMIIPIIITSIVSNFPENYFIFDRKRRSGLISTWSVTKYLRELQHARCLFRAVSVRFASRNYRRILLLRLATLPLPPLPSTPARLLGRVFRHVVAVCSTIITAIWTIHRTGNVHRSLALFTRNYLFDRDGWYAVRTSSRVTDITRPWLQQR